mmetsp:Transcript_16827/g.44465  ORF Transcript_16827/g.44465 Transcript_16827/m.44465 type:complete len:288 (-) Transcript_16827:550-1413(-)
MRSSGASCPTSVLICLRRRRPQHAVEVLAGGQRRSAAREIAERVACDGRRTRGAHGGAHDAGAHGRGLGAPAAERRGAAGGGGLRAEARHRRRPARGRGHGSEVALGTMVLGRLLRGPRASVLGPVLLLEGLRPQRPERRGGGGDGGPRGGVAGGPPRRRGGGGAGRGAGAEVVRRRPRRGVRGRARVQHAAQHGREVDAAAAGRVHRAGGRVRRMAHRRPGGGVAAGRHDIGARRGAHDPKDARRCGRRSGAHLRGAGPHGHGPRRQHQCPPGCGRSTGCVPACCG